MLFLAGCGESTSDTTNYTEPVSSGPTITMTAGGDGNLIYTDVGDGSIVVTCEEGASCGDINVGFGENGYITTDDGTACLDGDQGECEDGFFWCPIEGKCIPKP